MSEGILSAVVVPYERHFPVLREGARSVSEGVFRRYRFGGHTRVQGSGGHSPPYFAAAWARTFTASACAAKPSASAIRTVAAASFRNPAGSYRIHAARR